MRWLKLISIYIFFLSLAAGLQAAEAKIIKVLPHYLDSKGRHSLSPSLYERDAYQNQLRQNPAQRSGIRFDIQWKAPKRIKSDQLKMRVEMRGSKGNDIEVKTLEAPAVKKGWGSYWSSLQLDGKEYKQFGELVAWRVMLYQGESQIAEQKSFLW